MLPLLVDGLDLRELTLDGISRAVQGHLNGVVRAHHLRRRPLRHVHMREDGAVLEERAARHRAGAAQLPAAVGRAAVGAAVAGSAAAVAQAGARKGKLLVRIRRPPRVNLELLAVARRLVGVIVRQLILHGACASDEVVERRPQAVLAVELLPNLALQVEHLLLLLVRMRLLQEEGRREAPGHERAPRAVELPALVVVLQHVERVVDRLAVRTLPLLLVPDVAVSLLEHLLHHVDAEGDNVEEVPEVDVVEGLAVAALVHVELLALQEAVGHELLDGLLHLAARDAQLPVHLVAAEVVKAQEHVQHDLHGILVERGAHRPHELPRDRQHLILRLAALDGRHGWRYCRRRRRRRRRCYC
mmetsp:Transcript_23814/g.74945  ORF Transcript_23814/g.74945 Transcript_23814/m.74945 type:complete len:358 (-) Transcript_23814:81-1154(-)